MLYAKVYDRTGDAVIGYKGCRNDIIRLLGKFSYENEKLPETVAGNTGRSLSHEYQDKLFDKIVFHYARKWLLPYPLRVCFTAYNAVKYIAEGIRCLWNRKIEVPVLDATAIGCVDAERRYRNGRFNYVHARYRRASRGVDTQEVG